MPSFASVTLILPLKEKGLIALVKPVWGGQRDSTAATLLGMTALQESPVVGWTAYPDARTAAPSSSKLMPPECSLPPTWNDGVRVIPASEASSCWAKTSLCYLPESSLGHISPQSSPIDTATRRIV